MFFFILEGQTDYEAEKELLEIFPIFKINKSVKIRKPHLNISDLSSVGRAVGCKPMCPRFDSGRSDFFELQKIYL